MTEDSPSTTAVPLTSSLTFEASSCLIQQGNLLVFWVSPMEPDTARKVALKALHRSLQKELFTQLHILFLFFAKCQLPSHPALYGTLTLIAVLHPSKDREKNLRIREEQWFLEISNSVFFIVTHNHSFHPQAVSLWGLWLHPWHLLVQQDLCDIPKFGKCRWC